MRTAAAIGIGFLAATYVTTGQQAATDAAHTDLIAIQQLRNKDIAAAKISDTDTLATLWTDDAVALPPSKQPVIGIAAIREWLKQSRLDTTKMQTY